MKKVIVIPAAVLLLILVAFATMGAYRVPTLEVEFVEERPMVVESVEYTVDGLTCRGKSGGFANLISGVEGVVGLTTYVRTNTAIVEYDPALTDPVEIETAFEGPILHEGEEYFLFQAKK